MGVLQPSYSQNLMVICILPVYILQEHRQTTHSVGIPFFPGYPELSNLLSGAANCATQCCACIPGMLCTVQHVEDCHCYMCNNVDPTRPMGAWL